MTVAVLDSGIFAAHPDFGDRVTTGLHFAFSEIQDSGGISPEQWDDYAESTGAIALQDEIGHGTHVASTVGGSGAMSADAGGPNLAGVAPGVELVSMKVADAPFGIVEDLDWEEAALAAFDYIIRHPELGIDIAQNSWGLLPTEPNCQGLDCGEPTDFDAMAAMIGAVEDAGVTVVFSAGNDGPEPGTIGAYHRADQAILVGAACKSPDGSCPEGEITDFSSRGAADGTGPQVDVVAPGDQIMAAVSPSVLLPLTECPDTQQPGYYCISGTSMASPHVSGVAALMIEANPAHHARAGDRVPRRYRRRPARPRRRPGLRARHGGRACRGRVRPRADPGAARRADAGALRRHPSGPARTDWPPPRGSPGPDTRRPTAPGPWSWLARTASPTASRERRWRRRSAGPCCSPPPTTSTRSPATRSPGCCPRGGRVVLLGGPAALSAQVAADVERAGYSPQRLQGETRYDTAVVIARRLDGLVDLDTAIVARGDDFPDALAAGPAATASTGVVLLSDGDRPHPTTQAWLDGHPDLDLVAVGGPAARAHPEAREVAGATREATAVAVAEAFLPDASAVGVARRDGFADALTGGVYAASRGMPVLLSARDALPEATATHVEAGAAGRAVVFGGPSAISEAVLRQLEQRLR